jgi:hypothetical protein
MVHPGDDVAFESPPGIVRAGMIDSLQWETNLGCCSNVTAPRGDSLQRKVSECRDHLPHFRDASHQDRGDLHVHYSELLHR